MSRFPLTNKPLLEKWENIIRDINSDQEWQATSASRICMQQSLLRMRLYCQTINRFELQDKKQCCPNSIFYNTK